MIRSESVGAAAPDLLEKRFGSGVTPAGLTGREFWCPSMPKTGSVGDAFRASRSAEPVCGKLRAVFGEVSEEPMPDDLTDLANLLEAAFERGELFSGKTKRATR